MADVGTVVLGEELYFGGPVKKITFTWTSDAAGAADKQTVNSYSGKIEALVTIPGTAGNAPTTLYDITVLDEDGNDVIAAAGADRSATLTQQVLASSLSVVANDKLYLHVTNAGNAKQGTVIVYLR